jgi:LysM repeat protein
MNPTFILKGLLLTLAFFGTLSTGCGTGHAADPVRPTATETENGYYYTVQKGDTLWDLSRRFSTTPWVWPELWEENSTTIANPHLIYPGQKIRLTRLAGGRPSGPSAAASVEPAVSGIHYYFSLCNQYGFIRKVPTTPAGVIFKSQDVSKKMLSEGDIVYIRPEGNAALNKGELMTIYRTFKPLVDPKSKELIGTQHLLCGVLEVVQREPQYAMARVVESYRPIEVGDQLMPFQRRSPRIEIQRSQPGIDAKLILSEEHLSIFAESYVAFIDRGQRHGIKPGQLYSIYQADDHHFGTVSAPQTVSIAVDYGELLVLHAEDGTSTVLITDSKKEFKEGSRVRTPLAMR